LLHWPAIAVFSRVPDPHSPLTFAATFALTLGGSFALYYAVERPLRGRIRRALSDGERLPLAKIDIASTIEHVRVA
jgi:peptidoglycan/LPS O-acetylase OafA/YrhL